MGLYRDMVHKKEIIVHKSNSMDYFSSVFTTLVTDSKSQS